MKTIVKEEFLQAETLRFLKAFSCLDRPAKIADISNSLNAKESVILAIVKFLYDNCEIGIYIQNGVTYCYSIQDSDDMKRNRLMYFFQFLN